MKKIIVVSLLAGACSMALLTSCGTAAAHYWDGKKFVILESHWGAPTETNQNEDGTSTAIFRTTSGCVVTVNIDAQGVIMNHTIEGSCSYDAYNRLVDIQH